MFRRDSVPRPTQIEAAEAPSGPPESRRFATPGSMVVPSVRPIVAESIAVAPEVHSQPGGQEAARAVHILPRAHAPDARVG
jgi:hypothetical protein